MKNEICGLEKTSNYRDWSKLATALVILTTLMLTLDQIPVIRSILNGIALISARYTSVFLSLTGMDVHQEGSLLFHPSGFRYDIEFSCTSFIPLAFLGVAIIFFPAPRQQRTKGFLISVPYVVLINQLRLCSLFYIGTYHPQVFVIAHEFIWECLMVVFVGGFWVVWIRRVQADIHRLKVKNQAWGELWITNCQTRKTLLPPCKY